MHDEDGFLAAISETPADDTARLVYADWLDEQDDPTYRLKSTFIRSEICLATDPDADYESLSAQLHQLATQLPPPWLAVISRPKIEGCTTLHSACPGVWSNLTPTQDPNARTCAECRQTVRYARTPDEVHQYHHRGFCMVATLAIPRFDNGRTTRWPRALPTAGLEREPLIDRPRLRYGLEVHEVARLQAEAARDTAPPDDDDGPPGGGRKPPRTRRKSRQRTRNLQRENWEEE